MGSENLKLYIGMAVGTNATLFWACLLEMDMQEMLVHC